MTERIKAKISIPSVSKIKESVEKELPLKIGIIEEKASKITMIPFEYTFCPCCLNCLHRNVCELGKYGDRGICKEYHEDKNAMPREY